MSARLLMVALDGADGRMLDRGSADGSLPHLAALRAGGRAHGLGAMEGITDDALWASFQYTVDLAQHGRYHYEIPLRDGRIGMAHYEETTPSFWHRLSERGLRVAVIDVPKCGAPRPINGLHLVDWLVHGRYFAEGPCSYPPQLVAEVLERFGPAPPSQCDYEVSAFTDDDIRDVTRNLRASVAKKRAAGLHYLSAEPWDLFILGFKEAHCSSHAFWDLTDAGHPTHDSVRRQRVGDPTMAILQEIDAAIGDLVAAAGTRAEVVVFSTTDFEPNGSLDHLAPQLIQRLNQYLAATPDGPIKRLIGRWGAGAAPVFSAWQCAILPYNENWLALRVLRLRRRRLRRRPREVPPAALLQAIEIELRGLRDAGTGECVVSAIVRPASELAGSCAATLPDLLVQCATGVFPQAVVSPLLGRMEARSPAMRPGNHTSGGFLIARGTAATAAAERVRTMTQLGVLAETVLS